MSTTRSYAGRATKRGMVFQAIVNAGDWISTSKLSEITGVQANNVSGTIVALRDEGSVESKPNPERPVEFLHRAKRKKRPIARKSSVRRAAGTPTSAPPAPLPTSSSSMDDVLSAMASLEQRVKYMERAISVYEQLFQSIDDLMMQAAKDLSD